MYVSDLTYRQKKNNSPIFSIHPIKVSDNVTLLVDPKIIEENVRKTK